MNEFRHLLFRFICHLVINTHVYTQIRDGGGKTAPLPHPEGEKYKTFSLSILVLDLMFIWLKQAY